MAAGSGGCARGVRVASLLVLALLLAPAVHAGSILESYHLSAKAKWEAAVGFHHPVEQKSVLSIEPRLEATFAGGFDVVAIARLRTDPANELRPDDPKERELWKASRSARIGDFTELALRELYVHRRFGRAHATIGKQQVVWGNSDGFKVLDLVNPQDFREFILDEFVDSRLPTWMLNLTFPLAMFQTQLLWIPDRSYAETAVPGSVYELRSPQFVPAYPALVPVRIEHPDRPSEFFGDSEIGIRLAATAGKWDLTLNYLWAFDDAPAPKRRIELDPAGPSAVVVTPHYRRTNYIGGSVNRTIGTWVLRSELVYSTDRQVYTTDLADADGLRSAHELNTVFGVDWFGLKNTLASMQLFLRYTGLDDNAGSPQAGWSTIPTLLVRRTMWSERLVAQVFWLQDAARGDGLARFSLRWEMRDDITWLVGSDVFYGSSRGILGQYDHADRFLFGIEATR